MNVIGVGLGRTGTDSLRLAINTLGFGPCHHMHEVVANAHRQVPLWEQALAGKPDWAALYRGYNSAVDWPSVKFYRELSSAFPAAKFILSTRTAESWADSFASTIYSVLARRGKARSESKRLLEMAAKAVQGTGIEEGLDRDALIQVFRAHSAAVKATIPPSQLLEYSLGEGWPPLCRFLGVDVPDEPYPHSNPRIEFANK